MLAKRKWRLVLVVLAVACMVPSLSAVIVEIREYHGKQVSCIHSGLRGVAKQCGTEGYARVFTGFVRSSVEVGDTDKILQLVPDEAFVGDSSEATVITNQACLNTDIQAGDRWLFYLYRDPKSDRLILSYDGPSKPITQAEDDVSMLRKLGHLTDTGIIIGTIERLGETGDVMPTPLANHKVVARNVKNGDEYSAYTSEGGYFTFELPVGRYDVTPAPEYRLLEVEEGFAPMLKGSIPVEKLRCWEHDFAVKPATSVVPPNGGTISGHLGSPDGKPFTVHPWVQIVSVDSEVLTSAYVDTKGYFEAKNVKPGRYVVGLGIRAGTGYFSDVPTPVYYPGVGTKEQATIIELGPREKRTNIDFQLPIEDVLKPLGQASSNR
jgi:hypothetical protein